MDFDYDELEPDKEDNFCERYDPKKDPEEFCSLISMVMVGMGLLLIGIGYITPRDYEFDPDQAARKMEAIAIYYYNLSFNLDVVILAGMGFVGLGGLLYAAIFVSMFFTFVLPCHWCCEPRDQGATIPLCATPNTDNLNSGAQDYGSTETRAATR